MRNPNSSDPTRRRFVAGLLGALALSGAETALAKQKRSEPARLSARPGAPTLEPHRGCRALGLGKRRDGFLCAPASYDPARPAPLLVMLHGANGNARRAWKAYEEMVDARGLVLLAIDSRGRTWDAIARGWGSDVSFLDEALAHVFERFTIDPARLALGGFSDGASYALALGIANGDLFSHLVAFAPGHLKRIRIAGAPRIFVSHGRRDKILPASLSRARVVPSLLAAGFDVTYLETELNHTVDWDITNAAMDWFLEAR